jgi:hypothetical protein
LSETTILTECRAARMPKDRLSLLAPLRRSPDVQIVESADAAWIVWQGEMPSVVRALLPAAGVTLYSGHDGAWRPLGSALPDFTVPFAGAPMALHRAVVPAPVSAVQPPAFVAQRVKVTLVRDARARPTTSLRCSLESLAQWCDHATTQEIEQLRGAVCGHRVWLLRNVANAGNDLPPLDGADRFWGRQILMPLGMRADPDWPETSLRLAAVVDDDEILALTSEGAEALPVAAFRSLSRAAVRRLALASIDNS